MKHSVAYYFHRFRGSEPEHRGWLGLEEYQHPKEDAALFLALSLSSSEAAAVQPVLSRPRHEDAR